MALRTQAGQLDAIAIYPPRFFFDGRGVLALAEAPKLSLIRQPALHHFHRFRSSIHYSRDGRIPTQHSHQSLRACVQRLIDRLIAVEKGRGTDREDEGETSLERARNIHSHERLN